MNAETGAWGRAIVAVLAADTSRGIATAQDVRNRQDTTQATQSAKPKRMPDRPSTPVSDDPFAGGWPFGKEKGKPLAEVSETALEWFVNEYQTRDPKWAAQDQARKQAAAQELERRNAGVTA